MPYESVHELAGKFRAEMDKLALYSLLYVNHSGYAYSVLNSDLGRVITAHVADVDGILLISIDDLSDKDPLPYYSAEDAAKAVDMLFEAGKFTQD